MLHRPGKSKLGMKSSLGGLRDFEEHCVGAFRISLRFDPLLFIEL